MDKTSKYTIFILSCLTIFNLNFTNAQDSKFVLAEEATEDDVKSLRAISAKEALPFILFATTQSKDLERPLWLTKAEIKDGRFASGTTFQAESTAPQIFFCPNLHDAEKCLAPKQFAESQVLECEIEPKYILETRPLHEGGQKRPCGASGKDKQLLFVYRPYSYTSIDVLIYSICYEKSAKRVLSAYHAINDAAMLSEKLLTRERQIEFEIDTENYGGLVDETYYTSLKAEAQSKPQYKLQKLVPSEDMTFAWSIKPTHHFVNFALQHEDLIEPWNYINGLIRTHAENSLEDILRILTGVIDIPEYETSTLVDENQKNNIWVSVIAYPTENSTKEVAIMMNNFIPKQSKNQVDAEDAGKTSKKQYIDKICGKDLCADRLKQVFEKVGGQVRCCRVTNDIMNLFYPTDLIELPDEVLHIPNLTSSVAIARIQFTYK